MLKPFTGHSGFTSGTKPEGNYALMTSQESEILFHQNTNLSTQVERFSATEQEKYYNHIIKFNT